MEDEFIEHVQKRIRNLQKRKVKLEGYETTRQNDPSKLNPDQIAALANKDSVDAPLKELQDALKLYQGAQDAREKKHKQEIVEATAAAEERGRNESRDTLRLFSLFLRTAAVKHQVSDTPADELAAVDQLLQQLYLGDETSLEAIDKLAQKSGDIVHGTWTYAQVHKLTSSPQKEESKVEEAAEEKPEEKISFLQEDELAKETPKEPKVDNKTQEPKIEEVIESKDSQKDSKAKKEKLGGEAKDRNANNNNRRRKKPAATNSSDGSTPNSTNASSNGSSDSKITDDGWEKAESRRGGDKKQNRGNRPQRRSK